jgi:hypothetical protein
MKDITEKILNHYRTMGVIKQTSKDISLKNVQELEFVSL